MKKIFFQKKSHSAEKCKRGDPSGFINKHSVAKYRKTQRGDPSGFINKHSVAKYRKTQRGDPLGTLKNFRKKVAQCRKKSKWGTLWARPVLYVSLKK